MAVQEGIVASTGLTRGQVYGASIGFYFGGVGGASAGFAVGGMLDPPPGPTLVGPRLGDLSAQTSTYGANISRIYGSVATKGNLFWLEGDRLKETLTKKKSGGKGGGGSTVKTYSYSATFAVGLCEGPIAGVRRIWVGAKLIYDAGPNDVESVIASNRAAQSFRVYLGTEDQQPDPRMQADKGVANTPAYRGLAYIVLYDYQLKDHGNSLLGAQVKVEVLEIASSTGFALRSSLDVNNSFQSSGVMCRAFRYQEPFLYFALPLNDSRITSGLVSVRAYNVLTGAVLIMNNGQTVAGSTWGAGAGASDTLFFGTKDYNPGVVTPDGVIENSLNSFGQFYAIKNGTYYTLRSNGQMLAFSLSDLTDPGSIFIPPFPINTAVSSYMWAVEASENYVYFGVRNAAAEAVLIKYERDGLYVGHVVMPAALDGISVMSDDRIYYVDGSQLRISSDFMATSELIATVPNIGTDGLGDYAWTLFEPAPGFIIIAADRHFGLSIRAYQTFPNIADQEVALSDIVSGEIASSLTLSPADVDVSSLTDLVRGYRITQTGAIRAAIEPLQAAWPFDVIQSGYKIKAVPRGGASVATIPAELLDARAAGDASGPQIAVVREMDTQLPRRVSIKHMDHDREYDIGEQYAERGSSESIGVRELEMPIVFTGAEAAQKAEVLLYLYWLERHTIQFKLPPEYLGLEPADVITITATDAAYELRLTNINYLSDGRLECVARYNSAAIYASTATGEASPVVGGVIGLDGPSKYELLDIPALRSEMDAPMFVAAMTGYTTAWPGGILYRSSDGGQSWDDLQGWTGKCTMGSARNALSSHPGSVIDAASVLQVDLLAGEMESVTELAMLNGSNHFAYGAHGRWEIIAAKNCVVQGDGSYYLTDLLRGRFGTEHNTGSHAAGDAVILLNDPDLALIGMDSASIGLSRSYRGITAGRTLDSDADRSFTYSGVNLECLSPVYLNGNRHPSTNDWTLTWIRRTRISGEWRDLIDTPLPEATEAYEVDVFSSAAYTTLKRTLTSTTPTVAYTSAQQVTDFGSNQATLYLRIYQLSATVGRGFPLETTITR